MMCNLISIIILLCGFLHTQVSVAQPSAPPPKEIWVSLAYSSLDMQTLNWRWLEEECSKGHVINQLGSVSKNISGIIVPVFDDGRCFYRTEVSPFKDRNLNAEKDEQALRGATFKSCGYPGISTNLRQ